VSRGRRLDLAVSAETRGADDRTRRWIREAAYGTVRLRGRLDHLLDHHVDRGLASVHSDVVDVLRLGAYQLLNMGSVPPYAAITEAVDQVRAVGRPGAAGLVNAVLRGLGREGGERERFPGLDEDPVGHLATWGSHPRWLVERWVERFGVEATEGLVHANNRIPPMGVRPVGASTPGTLERARAALESSGIPVAASVPEAGVLILAESAQLEPAMSTVRLQVQDPGAAMVIVYAAPEGGAGEWYADLCAAPGGKAVALAEGGNPVLALDPSTPRLRLVRDTAVRLELPIFPVRGRGESPPVESARLVLVDVPCSGTGTLRRHPDARWRLQPSDLGTFVRLQAGILEGAARAVEIGGLLVYSTCTLEPEENRLQVEDFLKRHPEFEMEPPEGWGSPRLGESMNAGGFLEVLPQVQGHDGAFAARMRRVR
jgi:16S rRNA (cytosine967-C5)-methyltransferase